MGWVNINSNSSPNDVKKERLQRSWLLSLRSNRSAAPSTVAADNRTDRCLEAGTSGEAERRGKWSLGMASDSRQTFSGAGMRRSIQLRCV